MKAWLDLNDRKYLLDRMGSLKTNALQLVLLEAKAGDNPATTCGSGL
jgi:hypothetical protein